MTDPKSCNRPIASRQIYDKTSFLKASNILKILHDYFSFSWIPRKELCETFSALLSHELSQSCIPRSGWQFNPIRQMYLWQAFAQKCQNFTISRLRSTKTHLKGVQTEPRDLVLIQWERSTTRRQLVTLTNTRWVEIQRQIQNHSGEEWWVISWFATCNKTKETKCWTNSTLIYGYLIETPSTTHYIQ